MIQMVDLLQMQVPQYMGLRRTLEFHHQDGRKMEWIMLEYQQLDDIQSPALLLQVGDIFLAPLPCFRFYYACFIHSCLLLVGGHGDSQGIPL